jgi:hypothetical protein
MPEPGPGRFAAEEPLLSDPFVRGLSRELQRARQAVDTGGTASQSDEGGLSGIVSSPRRGFWARIIGQNAADNTLYSFVEVARDFLDSSTFLEPNGAVTLTDKAREVNLNQAVPLSAVVWMEPSPAGLGTMYDFEYAGAPASGTGSGSGLARPINLVTNVCPVYSGGSGSGSGSGSGLAQQLTGFTVEYTPVTLPAGTVLGTPFCTTNPAGCCSGTGTGTGTGSGSGGHVPGTGAGNSGGVGTTTVACCSTVVLPNTLHLTVTGGPACAGGNFTLTWDSVHNDWRGWGNLCNGRETLWRFYCLGGTADGFNLTHDCLDVGGGAFFNQSNNQPLTTAACSPFHVAGTTTTGAGVADTTQCYPAGQTWTWNVLP